MYLSPRNSKNRGLLRSRKWHLLSTDTMSQLTNHNVGQSNLIYAVICHLRRNREGQWGQLAPNFGAVCTVPPNCQLEQSSCYLLYFVSFLSIKRPKGET